MGVRRVCGCVGGSIEIGGSLTELSCLLTEDIYEQLDICYLQRWGSTNIIIQTAPYLHKH